MHMIVYMDMHTGPGLRPRRSQWQGAFVGSVTSPKATPLHSAMFMRVCLYVWMCGCVDVCKNEWTKGCLRVT